MRENPYTFRLSGEADRKFKEYAEGRGLKYNAAAKQIVTEAMLGGFTSNAADELAARIADEVTRVSKRGSLAALATLMLLCAQHDNGTKDAFDGLNAGETYEMALEMARMSLGQKQEKPDYYKMVKPSQRAVTKSSKAKDGLVSFMAEADSRLVMRVLDEAELRPWFGAMKTWRVANAMIGRNGRLGESGEALFRQSRSDLLRILADMEISSVDDARYRLASQEVYSKAAGWHAADDVEMTRRLKRDYDDFPDIQDPYDPNWPKRQ